MANTATPTWGEGVRELRTKQGLSQVQLSKATGLAQSAISRIENGSRQVSDAARVRIAKALGADPHGLFPYEDEQVSA